MGLIIKNLPFYISFNCIYLFAAKNFKVINKARNKLLGFIDF